MSQIKNNITNKLKEIRQLTKGLSGYDHTIQEIVKLVSELEYIVIMLDVMETDDGSGVEYVTIHPDMCIVCGGWVPGPGKVIPVDFPGQIPKVCSCGGRE